MEVTWIWWAGLQTNSEPPEQPEMTRLLCKVRSSDTALDRKSEGEQVLGVTQHFSVGNLYVCVW